MAENQKPANENKPKREKKNRNAHGVSVSAKTNAFGLVSIILIIGMIATMFFAVSYTGQQQFMYFSPSLYLRGISSQDSVISDAWYSVDFISLGMPGMPNWEENKLMYRPYVVIGGLIFYGTDVPITVVQNGTPIAFEIFGNVYFSEYIDGAHVLHVVDLVFGIGEMPDLRAVGRAWSAVGQGIDYDGPTNEELNNFFITNLKNAFKVTGDYIIDSVKYEFNVLSRLLPWNSVKRGDRVWIDEVWANKENELGLSE